MHSIKMVFILVLLLVVLTPVSAQDNEQEISVRVWWPDTLYPTRARVLINGIFESFSETQAVGPRYYEHMADGDVHVLDLTRRVAPEALPDLMLIRRRDMSEAVAEDLLRPIDNWAPASTIAGMPETLLTLGQVEGVLYGLPYLVEVKHMVYSTDVFEAPPTTLEAVLTQQVPMNFPGSPLADKVINDLLLTQYLSAGGTFIDANGNPMLDEAILLSLLTFYAEGVSTGVFSPDLLDYSSYDDYWPSLIAGNVDLGLILSSRFLERQQNLPVELAVAPIPTLTEETLTLTDGWVWVLLTADAERQAAAQRLLLWMMDTDRLADIAETLNTIPSQQRALRVLDDSYFGFIQGLLANTAYVEVGDNEAAAALQIAFEAVLNGGDPAEVAAATLGGLSTQ